jgi:hypothetical protein
MKQFKSTFQLSAVLSLEKSQFFASFFSSSTFNVNSAYFQSYNFYVSLSVFIYNVNVNAGEIERLCESNLKRIL